PYWILYSIVMSLGAMIGDLANSFIKRRLHIKAGNPFIPLDQLSFILSSYALVKILGVDVLLGEEITLVHLSIMTYVALVLHPLANLIAYILKLKDRPW
ncbi:MAG: CDP-2,3-bis-(O-geranylgeranyl)-sn-glycerol synthase, partial [Thermoprotei archaeon]